MVTYDGLFSYTAVIVNIIVLVIMIMNTKKK